MKVSIVIPTHNRLEKLRETVEKLRSQNFPKEDYEIIVVDDGSNPAVVFEKDFTISPSVKVVRLEGEERSVARNTGARNAQGELVIFIDDDIFTQPDFIEKHWQAHQDFSDLLAIGEILLPEDSQETPFGRFRQRLEKDGIPRKRGLVAEKNFCAAGNASIKKDLFLKLDGFDITLTSAEDQDFALRHTSEGGQIAFLPEASVIHQDKALDIRGYCQRNEWGSRLMLPFYQRYPDFSPNIEREKVNGKLRLGKEPLGNSIRKIFKTLLSSEVSVNILFKIASKLEKTKPDSSALDKVYRLLLGAHIFRGYRMAMKEKDNLKLGT